MTLVEPPVRWLDLPEPPSVTRFETLEGGLGAELSLAGRGSVRADAEAVTVSVFDRSARDELGLLADGWGKSLWLALNGTFSFHGTTLERDGFCLALLGESRAGCSVTAMALAPRGWRVVADGECPLRLEGDGSVTALPVAGGLEVDTAITTMTEVKWPTGDAGSRRPRSRLAVPESTEARTVGAIVEQRLARSTDEPQMVPAESSELGAARTLGHRCSLGAAALAANRPLNERLERFCEAAVSSTPTFIALIPEGKGGAPFPPSRVADFIDDEAGRLDKTPAPEDA